jgi:signal peptidase I
MRVTLRDILITLLLALFIFLMVQVTLESRVVEGSCMEPNFYTGQRLLVNKASYWFGEPQRGDVIIFHHPQEPSRILVKRVIALPGEWVEIRDGRVYINDEPLVEPYVADQANDFYHRTQVPDNCYFALGDNRNHSTDSRSWGVLPRENIIGKVWLRYWPLSDWHIIPSYSYTQD